MKMIIFCFSLILVQQHLLAATTHNFECIKKAEAKIVRLSEKSIKQNSKAFETLDESTLAFTSRQSIQ